MKSGKLYHSNRSHKKYQKQLFHTSLSLPMLWADKFQMWRAGCMSKVGALSGILNSQLVHLNHCMVVQWFTAGCNCNLFCVAVQMHDMENQITIANRRASEAENRVCSVLRIAVYCEQLGALSSFTFPATKCIFQSVIIWITVAVAQLFVQWGCDGFRIRIRIWRNPALFLKSKMPRILKIRSPWIYGFRNFCFGPPLQLFL